MCAAQPQEALFRLESRCLVCLGFSLYNLHIWIQSSAENAKCYHGFLTQQFMLPGGTKGSLFKVVILSLGIDVISEPLAKESAQAFRLIIGRSTCVLAPEWQTVPSVTWMKGYTHSISLEHSNPKRKAAWHLPRIPI